MICLILYFIIIQINSLEYYKFNFTIQSDTYLGFFMRNMKTSNQIYIGNNVEEGIYDLEKNEFIRKINNISYCHMGSVCPLLMFDETNITNITYVISFKNNYYYSYSMSTNLMNESNYLENIIPVSLYQYNQNEFILSVRINNKNKAQLKIINAESFSESFSHDESNVYSYSAFLADNKLLFMCIKNTQSFIGGGKTYIKFINKTSTVQNNSMLEEIYNYYQLVNLNNNSIIACSITQDEQNIYCFLSTYSDEIKYNSDLKITENKNLLSDCKFYNNDSENLKSFSFYKLTEKIAVLGCTGNKLKIILINNQMENIYQDYIELPEDNDSIFDFSPIFKYKLIVSKVNKVDNNNYEYYYTYFTLPICETSKKIIQKKEIKLSEFLDTFSGEKIIFTKKPLIGELIFENQEIELNTEYSFENIIYNMKNGEVNDVDFFSYKSISRLSIPQKEYYSNICSIIIILGDSNCEEFSFENEIKIKCIKCKDNYILNMFEQSKCFTCNNFWYYDDDDSIKCVENCPKYLPYYLEENNHKQCVENEKDSDCYSCSFNNYYKYKNKLILECPSTYDENNNCIIEYEEEENTIEEEENKIEEEIKEEETKIEEEIKEEEEKKEEKKEEKTEIQKIIDKNLELLRPKSQNINSNIKQYEIPLSRSAFISYKEEEIKYFLSELDKENNNAISIIKSDLYSIQLYSTNLDKKISSENYIPYIDLGNECEEKIRKENNIPKEENIYIAQITSSPSDYSNLITDKIQYEIYNENGNKLDLSICNDLNIDITNYFNVSDPNLNIELAKSLQDEYNIYDINDPLFNDKCLVFNLENKDITLSQRKDEIYTPIIFCEEGCSVKNCDLNIGEVECECNIKKDGLNNLIEDNEILSPIKNLIDSTNIELFKCAKLIKFKNMKNLGCILMGSILIIQGFCIFMYLKFNVIKINAIINNNIGNLNYNSNPPKKFSIIGKNIFDNNISNDKSSSRELKNDIVVYKDRNIDSEKKQLKPNLFINIDEKEKEEINDHNVLNNLEFEEAIVKDKRSFIKYYFSIICEKQIFFSTIFGNSLFYPIFLRLIILCFILSFFFFLNGLFFTEEYITKRNNSNMKLNFIYIIKYEIKKSVYSSIITLFISKFINSIVSVVSSTYYEIIKEKNDFIKMNKLNNLIITTKKKLNLLLIVIIAINLIIWYFLIIFSCIYQHNQLNWLEATMISIFINIIIPLILCLICSIFRVLAFKFNNLIIFQINQFLYILI